MSDPVTAPDAASAVTPAEDPLAHRLRRFLLWLAVATTAGTTVELVSLQHWTEKSQLIAWAAVAVLAAAIVVVFRASTPQAILVARVLAVGVCGAAAIGVVAHVHGNYEAGPLDAQYGEQWDSMSAAARTGSVTGAIGPRRQLVASVP